VISRDDIYYFADPDYFNRVNHITPPAGPAPTPRTHTAEEEEDKRQLEQLKFYYDYNSAVLLTESRKALDMVAAVLKPYVALR
jgi:hypothetical protein